MKDRGSVRKQGERERGEGEAHNTQDVGGETHKVWLPLYSIMTISIGQWAGTRDTGGRARHTRLNPNNLPLKGECAFKQGLLAYN